MIDAETEKTINDDSRIHAKGVLKVQQSQNKSSLQRAVITLSLKHMGLTESQALEKQKEIDDEFVQTETAAERQRLIEVKKREAKCNEISWEIFFKTLTPTSQDGSEPLKDGWTHKFVDPMTNAKSKSVAELTKEKAFAIPDLLALTDADAFARKIAEVFDHKIWSFTFNRREVDSDRWRGSSSRWFEVYWQTKQTRFPPKAPKT